MYQPTEALETETKSHEKLKAKRAKKKKMGAGTSVLASQGSPLGGSTGTASETLSRDYNLHYGMLSTDLLRKREAKRAAEQAEQAELDTDTTEEASASPKRGRGRPRKSLATIAAPFRAPITSVGLSSPGGPSLPQRPAPASPSVRQAREPPQQPSGAALMGDNTQSFQWCSWSYSVLHSCVSGNAGGGSGAVRQLAAAAARPQHVPTWGLAQVISAII